MVRLQFNSKVRTNWHFCNESEWAWCFCTHFFLSATEREMKSFQISIFLLCGGAGGSSAWRTCRLCPKTVKNYSFWPKIQQNPPKLCTVLKKWPVKILFLKNLELVVHAQVKSVVFSFLTLSVRADKPPHENTCWFIFKALKYPF